MAIKRRSFLLFFGASVGTVALNPLSSCQKRNTYSPALDDNTISASGSEQINFVNFDPIKYPVPLEVEKLAKAKQIELLQQYEVIDDLVLPPGYEYQIIAAWGEAVGNSRFGYNNDYLSFVETAENEGFLTVNFEYISGSLWMETYPQVIGKSLPFTEVIAAAAKQEGNINAFSLSDNDPLKAQIQAIAKESLTDLGLGIISLRQNAEGSWERTNSDRDRRITGISGLEDDNYLKSTGPAVAVFTKQDKIGYDDRLGDKIVGSFQNCSGGTTPWGTVFSAEENFQDQVPEEVMADGSAFDPSSRPFSINDDGLNGSGNVFGLAGNKYGWMVEVDPANPNDYGTKHTWLGRFRHEAVGIKAEVGKKLAIYSGCDRRGGHVYKFVSEETIGDIQAKSNSRLLEKGMLYGAKFNPDGTGKWIPLTMTTPVNPVLPSQTIAKEGKGLVTLPNSDRNTGGTIVVTSDEEATSFSEKFATLGDLYLGNDLEKQGAILIDAHNAANAAGVTCTARPEDTDIAPDGSLYIAFTSGTPGSDGSPDKEVFQGPKGETPWEFGWIFRLEEENNDPAAMSFRWSSLAMGGEPVAGGAGFANPDNLEIDSNGNVWMVTDISTSKHNEAVPTRLSEDGTALNQSDIQGIFGNNSIWFIPTSGDNAGNAYPFAIGPMECETTGPFFTRNGKTLFLAVQHPGENNGMRQNQASETRKFALKTTDGDEFIQERIVPLGSNWPRRGANDPPLPAVVAIRRVDGKAITEIA
ncbi:MAG: DUF839 domain-containing protein [Oscillatoria sp. PMC 1051.18]|nr:DUF839 domain-containing protein [Oscillatoria sp. PMC 1050.18]MEC5030641.1 DUF839 domain-containing protein [Oscillatoria sp. PMC 1051.18]